MTFVKKFILIIVFLGFLVSCSSDDRVENPFLPNVSVNFEANLNLPQFGDLEFSGNSVAVEIDGIGVRGLIIYNVNGTNFNAFELSDPNHTPNTCSSQTVNGSVSTCKCDDGNKYDLNTGLPISGGGEYALKRYRVQKQGNSLIITN